MYGSNEASEHLSTKYLRYINVFKVTFTLKVPKKFTIAKKKFKKSTNFKKWTELLDSLRP